MSDFGNRRTCRPADVRLRLALGPDLQQHLPGTGRCKGKRAILSPKGARTLSPSAKAKTFGLIIQTIARKPIFSAAANDRVLGVCIRRVPSLGRE
jgi:hypothetical protein